MISEKQMLANQRNALRSTGPKTATGKALAAHNSLRHGLLAKEVVITEGEGAENKEEFDALLADLIDQFNPVGSWEEILVEKIATCYWRLKRANRYEVGVLRQKLDTVTDDYYNQRDILTDTKKNKTDVEMDNEIEELLDAVKTLKHDHKKLKQLSAKGVNLEEIYDDDGMWERVEICRSYLLIDLDDYSPQGVKEGLNKNGYSDDKIWQLHIEICQEQIDEFLADIEKQKKEKATNKLRLSAKKKRGALPPKLEMDNLLRYETAIERQLYKAINQLERLQRQRAGEHVPAPVQVDLNTSLN